MAEIVLITGGSRSGKSRRAQEMAETAAGKRVFLATCPVLDAEMAERIERHRRARGAGWITVEETVDLPGALRRAAGSGRRPFLLVLQHQLQDVGELRLADGQVLLHVHQRRQQGRDVSGAAGGGRAGRGAGAVGAA
jgi:hypothetical protein